MTYKLHGKLTEAGNLTFPNANSAVERDDQARHDARLAHELLAENGQLVSRIHEMLPVIRQLVDALSRHQNYCRVIEPENQCECLGCQALRALNSAAPFLDTEED